MKSGALRRYGTPGQTVWTLGTTFVTANGLMQRATRLSMDSAKVAYIFIYFYFRYNACVYTELSWSDSCADLQLTMTAC